MWRLTHTATTLVAAADATVVVGAAVVVVVISARLNRPIDFSATHVFRCFSKHTKVSHSAVKRPLSRTSSFESLRNFHHKNWLCF